MYTATRKMNFSKQTDVYENRLLVYKLMPWLSWEEWNLIREALFSFSPESVIFATSRIAAWRNKWNLPDVIEITLSFIQIQLRDPYFRKDLAKDELIPDNLLSTLYCMEVVRLVNAVIEKTRNASQASIAEAATEIGVPRMLIDIRHESSHRDLPSIQLSREASILAVKWLKSYYWDPQREKTLMSHHENPTTHEEVIYMLRELMSLVRRRRDTFLHNGMKDSDLPCRGGKLFSIVVHGKRTRSSLSLRVKKRISRAVRSLVLLHRFFPSEVVSVLLDLLMSGRGDPFSEINPGTCHFRDSVIRWKPVVSKLSKWVPQLISDLIFAILDRVIQRQKASRAKSVLRLGCSGITGSESKLLDTLYTWLVQGKVVSTSVLIRLLRQCLLAAYDDLGGGQLLAEFAELLARETGDASLVSGVKKLTNSLVGNGYDPPPAGSGGGEALYIKGEKLCRQTHKRAPEKNRWRVVKKWVPCPIGMLAETSEQPHHHRLSRWASGDDPGRCVVETRLVSGGEKSRGAVFGDEKRKKRKKRKVLDGGVWRELEEAEIERIRCGVRLMV